jgi:AcrR family transcriptional regulator
VGLRETKAKRTRKLILHEALRLFKRDGYEETTMEAIAEAAEVSPSTLYRYFLRKDLILLDPLFGFDFPAAFSRHAVSLPVEEALAEAMFEWAKWQDTNSEEILPVRSLIDKTPALNSRVWDRVYQLGRDLKTRLAEKLHVREDDLQVELSVRVFIFAIVGTVADHWLSGAAKLSSIAYAKRVMRMFEEHKVLLPRKAPRR